MQNMEAAENDMCGGVGGVGWHIGEIVPSRAFLIFFCSSNASTAYPEKVLFLSVHAKTCFRGGCVPLGSVCPGIKSSLFSPQKPFSVGRIRLSFCMGVNRKRPLWLIVAP